MKNGQWLHGVPLRRGDTEARGMHIGHQRSELRLEVTIFK